MKKGVGGFTLLEVMVATAVMGTLVALLAGPVGDALSMAQFNRRLKMAQTAVEAGGVRQLVEFYFSRARDFTTTPVGAPSPGYLVSGQGALVMRTDLRACGVFNPSTSYLNANTTFVAISCCGNNNIASSRPGAGPQVNIASACPRDQGGITVGKYTMNPSTKALGLSSSNCVLPNVKTMNIANIGSQYFSKGASSIVLFDLLSYIPSRNSVILNPSYFSFTTAVGNPLDSLNKPLNELITCSDLQTFH
jgi:prepilin-type N-terminal cleavage/methylation domain-containing protein